MCSKDKSNLRRKFLSFKSSNEVSILAGKKMQTTYIQLSIWFKGKKHKRPPFELYQNNFSSFFRCIPKVL